MSRSYPNQIDQSEGKFWTQRDSIRQRNNQDGGDRVQG